MEIVEDFDAEFAEDPNEGRIFTEVVDNCHSF
jgi:hypothetical protein